MDSIIHEESLTKMKSLTRTQTNGVLYQVLVKFLSRVHNSVICLDTSYSLHVQNLQSIEIQST